MPAQLESGSKSARPHRPGRKLLFKQPLSARPSPFQQMMRRTVEAFRSSEEESSLDINNVLSEIRKQYDEIHFLAEKKEEELHRLRETLRNKDHVNTLRSDHVFKMEDTRQSLLKQVEEAKAKIADTASNKKVYAHMLERTKQESILLSQKLDKLESHLARKQKELNVAQEKLRLEKQKLKVKAEELDIETLQAEEEKKQREEALAEMESVVENKKGAIQRRLEFDRWRLDVAKEAASEAINANAGRLRKLWAIEKLAGNCLQKVIFEQVEKSQAIEDGFQKIREVTGLADVMDIVHRFLNRDLEQEQLKEAVKEAENNLHSLQEEHQLAKSKIDGPTYSILTAALKRREEALRKQKVEKVRKAMAENGCFSSAPSVRLEPEEIVEAAVADCQHLLPGGGGPREIYRNMDKLSDELERLEVEEQDTQKKLVVAKIKMEHVSKWAHSVHKAFKNLEKTHGVESTLPSSLGPQDLVGFFEQLEQKTFPNFVMMLKEKISSDKVQKKTKEDAIEREREEEEKVLRDQEFVKQMCRVQTQGERGKAKDTEKGKEKEKEVEEDSEEDYSKEREKFKQLSTLQYNEGLKKTMKTQKNKKTPRK